MKKNFVRVFAVVLAVLLLTVSSLAGCAGAGKNETLPDDVQENRFTFEPVGTVSINWDAMNGDDDETTAAATEAPTEAVEIPMDAYKIQTGTNVVKNAAEPVRYVMIYNPTVYDPNESYLNESLSTGELGVQVEVDLDKGGMETIREYIGISQDQINKDVPLDELIQEESDRAGVILPIYKVGDTQSFYTTDSDDLNAPRVYRQFSCRYAGTHCNVWVADGSMSDALAQDYGTAFDTYIYQTEVDTFGQPRFVGSSNNGKVNLLYYSLPTGIGGFFHLLDLFASDEVTIDDIFNYGVNTDHAILHINADFTAYESMQTFMYSTMAHEFQHLICATNGFENSNYIYCETWLNEAMSGYIEELLYPGVKEDGSSHMTAFRESNIVRNGQSLYNFDNTTEDYGVYGSVYLYSTYLAQMSGSDVFSNVHAYWRTSYSPTLCAPEALANAVTPAFYSAVDSSITYPSTILFDTEYEAWMSKLTLQFYLELLDKEDTDPASFAKVYGQDLLYNEINAASIEGGGRIIVALSGEEFVIPEDADPGLIYIGLDKDFNVVTPLIYA